MTVKTINPANGQVEYTLELMDSAAVESILAASASAFPAWSSRPLVERGELLRKVGVQLRTRREDIQKIMTAEMGKLRKEALVEIDKCAGACDYYAEHAADYLKDTPIATDGSLSYVRYEPLGCVLAVMPWNFPIWQVFRFLAPALMAGNVAVLKHASNVPRCADVIAEVLAQAGIPKGVFAALHIDNEQAAEVLRDAHAAIAAALALRVGEHGAQLLQNVQGLEL